MRNRKTLFASLFIAMFLCTMPHAFAKVWYVKTTGNNANTGATEALAKASIQAMLNSTSVVSGDTILVWAGTYQEQVVTGNLNVTIIGSQGTGRTIIQAPDWASMTTYTFADAMNWNGLGQFSSNKLKPIVFANASSSSIVTNIRGIDIDGSTANMPEGATEVFAGLAYRQSQGRIGGYGDSVYNEVRNIAPTTNTNALNNTVGVLFIERAKPTMIGTRVVDYRNIGIGSIGMNTSALQTVQDHQPSPIIINCIVQGEDGGTSSDSPNAIQAGLVVVNGARVNISKSHIYGNRSGNASGERIAYGIYTWNARNSTIGHNTVKSNGNVISDNELGLYVRITVSSFDPGMYTIKNNNIVYSGGTASNLGTAAGRVANYASATASNVTYGAVRFSHSSNFAQTLNVSNNAWGNAEASTSTSFSYSAANYTLANYLATPVAYWRETSNDNITYSNSLSPATTVELNVHSAYSGSNTSGEPIVDSEYGFTKFDQINRAVYAAGFYTGGAPFLDPKINVLSNVVESGSIIITKPVKIIGSGASCDVYPSVKLRNGLNEPTVWIYGMSHTSPNSDYTDRAPVRDTLYKLRILANNTQTSGGSSDGPAVLITGTSTGSQSPVKPVMSYMSISNEFNGSTGPQAYSTSQSGTSTLSMRHALLAAGPYYALYTRRPENCDDIVGGNNVIDNTDNNLLPKFQFENIIEVATCAELNQAIIDAEGPDFTTLLIIANIGSIGSPCEAFVNSTEPMTVDVQTGSTAFIHYLLNPGANPNYGGGTNAICSFLRTTPTSGGTHNAVRVTAYPPACLQTAVDLISSGPDNVLVASNGNNGAMNVFTDAIVKINKQFDYRGAERTTAHSGTLNNAEAKITGKFELNVGADIRNIGGRLYSTRGTTFGDADNQVDLSFSSITLPNYGGQAIDMSLDLIGVSGSRRLNLTTTNYSTETPTLNKRVFLSGLANRGSSTGMITLNGSGNCLVGNTDASSVLRNINVSTVTVTNLTDCIQTALGRVVDCDNSSQHIEGVGTNASNGSGGTVNLNPTVGSFNQNLEIAKAVTLNEGLNVGLGTGTLTLRRGADVSGSASFFADNISMTQCFSAHASGANPNMTQALALAGTGISSTITVAGYGSTNGVGQGSGARGVWQFSNINVNRDVTIRGNYHNVPSTLLSTDCSLLSQTNLPAVNPARVAGNETVIGGHGSNTFVPTGNRIFRIQDGGADIKGFLFNNVIASGGSAIVIGSGAVDNEISNNILTSTINNSVGLVSNEGGTANSDLDIIDNYVSLTGTAPSLSAVININSLTNASGQNSITGNAVSIGSTMGVVSRFANVNNSSSTGLLISGNWLSGGSSHVMLMNAATTGLNGIVVEQNAIRNVPNGIEIKNNNSIDPGANGLRIRENIFGQVSNGVYISGNFTTVTTNRIFVNNNDLSGSSSNGVEIAATTSTSGSSDNFFDLRFNYWGNDLGPVRGTNVASEPRFAPTDSVRTIGHVPFAHTSGSRIADGSTNGRWMIYPVVVTSNDGNVGTCGWQYGTMQAAVLRVNAAGTALLGMYDRIGWARDNSNAHSYPSPTGARTGTDQIFVIAQSTYTYGGATFGYNGAVESEGSGSYPITFTADPQPSVLRGINRPTITTDESGSIAVASTFPRDFTIKDFISHVYTSSNIYTGISFANPHSNTVEHNFITTTMGSPTLVNSFKGISVTNSGVGKTQSFTKNKINLGQDPRWAGGPSAAISIPLEFTGIEILSHGSNGTVDVSNNDMSTGTTSGQTKSVGIFVNAGNTITNGVTVNSNQIRGMASTGLDASNRAAVWGTGIYVRGGDNININENDIQGGNTFNFKGHDGITLDGSGINATSNIKSNNIGTTLSFSGTNMTSSRERGYGVKLFSSTGSANIGGADIWNNTFGSSTVTAPGVASFYVGGTSGTVGSVTRKVRFWDNFVFNSTESTNAAVQVATSQYTGAASSGYVTVEYTDFGSSSNSALDNAMFLAIGTTGNGATKNSNADNYSVDVFNNDIRTSEQTVATGTIEVADGRPNAGANIRNIFGYVFGLALNGSSTPGNGASGRNTFTHAAILTGEAGLANYTTGLTRTANAIAYPNASDPVVISRLIASPLASATSNETRNTVELRENAGWNQNTQTHYYRETLTFPDQRILISGPRSNGDGWAQLLPGAGGTGTMFTSTGRENKDIRGAIRFNAIGVGLFGRVALGAANKGDVYIQMDAIGVDNGPVAFSYHGTTFGSQVPVTQLNNSLTKTLDVKASFDDADDDAFTANTSTSRRTGVFRSGTSTSQFLKETPEAITGMNMLNVYPNPASGDVTVSFKVPVAGFVRVALYNALGQKVTDLREENLTADTYTTVFNAASLTNGTYHVRLVHDQFTLTTPVTIIK